MRPSINFILVITAAAVAAACDVRVNDKGVSVLPPFAGDPGRAEDEWVRSYIVPNGGTFELDTAHGEIEIGAATGKTVDVKARREVRGRSDQSARDLLQQLKIEEDITPERVRVQTPRPDRSGPFRQGIRIDYQIGIPAGLNVAVKTENGDVRLTGVQGRFKTCGQRPARGSS